jgi:hypothetical protein
MSEPNEIKMTEEMLAKAAAAGEKELERPRAKAVRYDAERVRLVID